jgi:hypothetical protein
MTEWISTKDRLPDKDGRYLVCENYNRMLWIGVGALRNGKFESVTTHWMELPEKPNE